MCVGSMGHASSIALGIAITKKSRGIVTLDGDGSSIMHLGALSIIGGHKVPNYIHIIFNNAVH